MSTTATDHTVNTNSGAEGFGASSFGERFRHDADAQAMILERLVELLHAAQDLDEFYPDDDLTDALSTVRNDLEELRKSLVRPYRLMVAGVQNGGKSTLVNALVGEWIMPVGARNVDALLSLIEHGDVRGGTVHYKDGAERETSIEEVKSLVDQRSSDRADEQARIDVCLIRLPQSNLRTFTLVNTPGLNDKPEVSERTSEAFVQADGILWVFDAARIEECSITGQVLELCRKNRHKIVAVLNRIDEVAKMGGPKAVLQVEQRFQELFGDVAEASFPFNAKAATLGLGVHPRAGKHTPQERFRLIEDSGYPPLLEHFESRYFGVDKRREKLDGARRRTEAGVDRCLGRTAGIRGEIENQVETTRGGSHDLELILNRIRRRQRRVDRALYTIAERTTQSILDNYLACIDRVGEETIGFTSLFKGGERVAAEVQKRLEEAAEKRMPRAQIELRLAREAEGVLLEEWTTLADELEEEIDIELEGEIVLPKLGRTIKVSGGVGPAIRALVEAVMVFALKAAGQRLAREGMKRAIQLAVREVLKQILAVVGKRLTVALVRQIAKYVNPALWALVAIDIKKVYQEIDNALAKARADVRLELESQHGLMADSLHDVLCDVNAKIATPIREGLEGKLGASRSDREKLELALDRVDRLEASLLQIVQRPGYTEGGHSV